MQRNYTNFALYTISNDKIFSDEKYWIEHISRTSNVAEMLKVIIYFKKNFLSDFKNQFGLAQNYQALVNLPDSNETYQWLMQHSDSVKVIKPREVREKLKKRLQKALENLKVA